MCACSVAQFCPILCDPMDWSSPGFSVHGITQERILEWIATSFSRGFSQHQEGDPASLSPALVGRFFYQCAIWKGLNRFTLKEAGGEGHCLMGGKKMDPQIREKKSKKRWTLEKDLWGKYRACKMKYLGMSGLGKEKTKDISLQIHLLHNLLCIPSRKFQDLR